MNAIQHAEISAKMFKGNPKDYIELHAWLDNRPLPLRHHTQGIFEAEKKFGYTITNSIGKHVPVRTILENHVSKEIGFIPTAEDYLRCMGSDLWMGRRNRELNTIVNHAKKA